MPTSIKNRAMLSLPGLSLTGCSTCSKYGYGSVAESQLDPQLFRVDGVGKIIGYDGNRDWIENPVALTYPFPCRGVEWNE